MPFPGFKSVKTLLFLLNLYLDLQIPGGFEAMSSCSETEEDQFFDTRDDISSVSDLGSGCSEGCPSSRIDDGALGYDFWTKKPNSVRERRDNFFKLMGLISDSHITHGDEDNDDLRYEGLKSDVRRLMDDGDAELANSGYEPIEDGATEDNPTFKIKNLDNGTEFVVDEQTDDVSLTTLHEMGSDKMLSLDELQKTFGSSEFVQQLLRKDSKGFKFNMVDSKKKSKSNWLQRFSSMTHIADRTKGFIDKTNENKPKTGCGVRVHVSKKRSKELSALYAGQEFSAHEGSILTMKFSPDGWYLASAGVDGVVRVWKVLEDDTVNKSNDQELDPSGLYLWLDHISELGPLNVFRENSMCSVKKSRTSSDSASVVLPRKVFQLSEKPLHEFHGHEGEVLALSWSKNGSLLSSSVDKTVRLWRVGHDRCLGLYSHNNYVTCVEFNPVDNNHFISGSIDGKIRIWEVEGGRVIDWTDIREIVTAVCYCPDGKGGIVGSMDGNCRFYDVIDNRLELGAQICLKGKKLPGKKITGFQYCPGDVGKVMVTSADSQVRIISRTDIVCKFKGHRSSGTRVPASFTSDGEHVVSVSEDSNIRVWNYTTHDQKLSRQKNVWSCESFLSRNASIAIPWGGLKNKLGALSGSILGHGHFDDKPLQKSLASLPDFLATSFGFFSDALYKGSATWPEEKLIPPKSLNPMAAVKSKSEFKFLKNNPHLWGLIIVTAGWDGCIRTFLNYGLPIRF